MNIGETYNVPVLVHAPGAASADASRGLVQQREQWQPGRPYKVLTNHSSTPIVCIYLSSHCDRDWSFELVNPPRPSTSDVRELANIVDPEPERDPLPELQPWPASAERRVINPAPDTIPPPPRPVRGSWWNR